MGWGYLLSLETFAASLIYGKTRLTLENIERIISSLFQTSFSSSPMTSSILDLS